MYMILASDGEKVRFFKKENGENKHAGESKSQLVIVSNMHGLVCAAGGIIFLLL